jgi:hypothetical protein
MLDPDNLAAHAERIRASEILGRSTRLSRLFDFLSDCSIRGKVPKETEIAIDVFHRTADFDSSQDRGEYRLLLEPAERIAPASEPLELPPPRVRRYLSHGITATLALSLILNAVVLFVHWRGTHRNETLQQVLSSPVWAPIVKDELPVTVVVGDYYIFGETDDSQEVTRLVREFGINSRLELEEYAQSHRENGEHYRDLDLTYLPSSVATALGQLMPVLSTRNKHVQVVLMSQLTPHLLTHSDIVYIGYLSGLGMLHDIVFAGSSFSVGNTYDEIVHRKSGQHYISQGASPWRGDAKYKDYGYFATFAGPGGNRVVIISGTRDAALANTAELAARPVALTQLVKQAAGKPDFEALYEVYGVDGANVDSRLLLASALNIDAMWRD